MAVARQRGLVTLMSSNQSAKIFEFPNKGTPKLPEADHFNFDTEIDPGVLMDDGMLALDAYPFEIDEPDPLLIVEGRNSDFVDGPGPSRMTLIQNSTMDQPVRRLRLKDLHPMDVAIIAGFLLIVSFI